MDGLIVKLFSNINHLGLALIYNNYSTSTG